VKRTQAKHGKNSQKLLKKLYFSNVKHLRKFGLGESQTFYQKRNPILGGLIFERRAAAVGGKKRTH
jgi:hypothetical protein